MSFIETRISAATKGNEDPSEKKRKKKFTVCKVSVPLFEIARMGKEWVWMHKPNSRFLVAAACSDCQKEKKRKKIVKPCGERMSEYIVRFPDPPMVR